MKQIQAHTDFPDVVLFLEESMDRGETDVGGNGPLPGKV